MHPTVDVLSSDLQLYDYEIINKQIYRHNNPSTPLHQYFHPATTIFFYHLLIPGISLSTGGNESRSLAAGWLCLLNGGVIYHLPQGIKGFWWLNGKESNCP